MFADSSGIGRAGLTSLEGKGTRADGMDGKGCGMLGSLGSANGGASRSSSGGAGGKGLGISCLDGDGGIINSGLVKSVVDFGILGGSANSTGCFSLTLNASGSGTVFSSICFSVVFAGVLGTSTLGDSLGMGGGISGSIISFVFGNNSAGKE
jgi:hypothetical protein